MAGKNKNSGERFDMFFTILGILEAIIFLIGIQAYRTGFLFMGQSRPFTGKPVGVLSQHAGIWLEIFLVSPLVAFIFTKFMSKWHIGGILGLTSLALVLSAFMLRDWAKKSLQLDETFALNGRLTFAGWEHGFYMFVATAAIFLYYFGTKHEATRPSVNLVSLAFAVHVVVGLVIPDLVTHHKVRFGTFTSTCVALLYVLCAWLNVKFR